MSEEQEPIDVVQVMYNALTKSGKTARVGCHGIVTSRELTRIVGEAKIKPYNGKNLT